MNKNRNKDGYGTCRQTGQECFCPWGGECEDFIEDEEEEKDDKFYGN